MSLALACFLYAGSLGWNSIHYAQTSKAALRWPSTEGTVYTTRSRRSTSTWYEYWVDGRAYTGSVFGMPNANPFTTANGLHKPGHRLLVYFDPAHPENSCVNRTYNEGQLNTNIFYASLAGLVGLLFFGKFYEWATAERSIL